MTCRPLIVDALLSPAGTLDLRPAQWDLLIRQGRRANLLAKLALRIEQAGLMARVPQAPRQHLISALRIANRQRIATRWEVACIQQALQPLGGPVVLLKGAAYLMAGLPAGQGRLFADVDVMVPKVRIDAAEAALIEQGWAGEADLSDYDRRYYRQWMHEIPPLRHTQRDTSLDLHHTILPETARVKVDTAALFAGVQALPDIDGIRVLAPVDMFLHSATHLFHEGELENGLRDLFDLDALLRHFGSAEPGFWERLLPRARELGLLRPMFYALRYTALLIETPVPAPIQAAALEQAAPQRITLALMDALYRRALMPVHASCDTALTGIARFALFVRSHWLRMPLHLLSVHLLRKGWMRLQPVKPPAEQQGQP